MLPFDRRQFVGASAGGFAALLASPAVLLRRELSTAAETFAPDTLFLTWRSDPTTTMIVQWVAEPYATQDSTVYCRAAPTAFFETTPPEWIEAKPVKIGRAHV